MTATSIVPVAVPGNGAATGIRFAFWGRCSTEDQQDPESSRNWQRGRAQALVEPAGGTIATDFFDIDLSRSIPPQRRPEAGRLLELLGDPGRGFEAVVVGEPQRAFYGNQFGLTLPVFDHYRVPLWVPEVGGAIDSANEAHELIMSVYGGISKGERNRIKIRVRSAMAAQAQLEGRYLGGRPPYGYRLGDAGPHPNPAKAADGRRLHILEADPVAAPVVRRIFTEYLIGTGIYAIAEGLTRDGIACPSAHDRARNRHRAGTAWAKSAVRAILVNPRYTGHQVWNRQRKDEVLIDVHDVAQGNTTKIRDNTTDQWIWSTDPVHPALITREEYEDTQERLGALRYAPSRKHPHHSKHTYALRGLVYCEICGRRMESNWTNNAPYYRCRFPREYARVEQIRHPLNVSLREDAVLPALDQWLASAFAPQHLARTLHDLAEASAVDPAAEAARVELDQARDAIAQCDTKIARYRAVIDAGADPADVAGWIAQVQAEKATHQMSLDRVTPPDPLTAERIEQLITNLGDVTATVRNADSQDKSKLYASLGVRLSYHPGTRTARAAVTIGRTSHWEKRDRGGT